MLATGLVFAGASPAVAATIDAGPSSVVLASHGDRGSGCSNPNFCAGEDGHDSKHEKIKKFKKDLRKAIKKAVKKAREHHGGGGNGGGGCDLVC